MRTPLLAVSALALAAGAAQADSIAVFSWSDYIAPDTLARFTEATGIDVVYDVYDSNEALEARLMAGRSGFDVVVPTADFMQRQIAAGIYQPLDRDLLPNLSHMDEGLMAQAAAFDPGNEHGVIYMWGTTGIGFNTAAITERLGEDHGITGWDMIFNPEVASQLADCGISLLDSPSDVMPAVLAWLDRDPRSTDPDDLEAAAQALEAVRPHLRYFHSSQYITDLANGEICVAMGWSGDVFQAADRAADADRGVEVDYIIPSEGAMIWFDMMVIPSDAPNPEGAHAFLNFIMEPEITAGITNYVWYANANTAAMEFVDPEIAAHPGIFPDADTQSRLFTRVVYDARTDRLLTRLWTRVRTGQ
ncbi:polyamine ABC transporter substrate-binding protein [Rhodobaculum claviforme]|uniref:Putrescine-binding periplasmic protein n=1 Tax=Rhodobaculum claviforme TaxID=1549854 RepID=A0A934TMG2_9RHOB|nr:polyamine ABC transporter substrate-binding protein [Rhodobaculum claviforme]MBK5928834.1 spermidine/putrescine ABC transporter substrate-binding protein PotF [Rhodobaculum claviforme]